MSGIRYLCINTNPTPLSPALPAPAQVILSVEADIHASEKDITALNAQQADIREEIAGLKGFNNQLKDGITARSSQLEQAVMQKQKLIGQIVSSPAR
jgi:chromosome segregation ATPase